MSEAHTTTRTGGCHCGKVRFEVAIDATSGLTCNCSICSKKGTILSFVPAGSFRALAGDAEQTSYQFNKHVIQHLFCPVCGVTSYARGKMPDGSAMVAVNLRTIDDIDVGAIVTKHHDGKSR